MSELSEAHCLKCKKGLGFAPLNMLCDPCRELQFLEIKKRIKVNLNKSTGKLDISFTVYLPGPTKPLTIDCAIISKSPDESPDD